MEIETRPDAYEVRRLDERSGTWTRFWRFAKETAYFINIICRWRRGKAFWRT